MPRYKHADILRAVADAAESSETPWDVVEFSYNDGWASKKSRKDFSTLFGEGREMRIKPKTRIINGREVPEALRVAPDEATKVWIEDATHETHAGYFYWQNQNECHNRSLARGIVHLTEESAVACCKARLGEGE